MSWRIVVISSRCKLDLSMNYMVVRGDGNKRVSLNEIAVLILENNAVSMTGCLLSALIEKKDSCYSLRFQTQSTGRSSTILWVS